ncbi:MAG: hypothetical protein SGARI_008066 [Bacillariaceae sp.]
MTSQLGKKNERYHLHLKGGDELCPNTAGDSLVDVTKMCSVAEVHDCQLNCPNKHDEQTLKPFQFTDGDGAWHTLKPVEGTAESIRSDIIAKVTNLIRTNPLDDYVDLTLELDIGRTVVQRFKWDEEEDEIVTYYTTYEAPAGWEAPSDWEAPAGWNSPAAPAG